MRAGAEWLWRDGTVPLRGAGSSEQRSEWRQCRSRTLMNANHLNRSLARDMITSGPRAEPSTHPQHQKPDRIRDRAARL